MICQFCRSFGSWLPSWRGKTGSVAVLMLLGLLSACDQSDNSGTVESDGSNVGMSITAPDELQRARNIVVDNLVLQVTIGGGDPINVLPDPVTKQFILRTTRPANSETVVSLTWYELIDEVLVPIASASKIL